MDPQQWLLNVKRDFPSRIFSTAERHGGPETALHESVIARELHYCAGQHKPLVESLAADGYLVVAGESVSLRAKGIAAAESNRRVFAGQVYSGS